MKRWRIKFRHTEFRSPILAPGSLRVFPACWVAKIFVAALLFVLPMFTFAGSVVDRVVANVNGHVVLQSDWEEEVSFEAFEDGKDPASFTEAERKAALDRLIDQELLREQVRPSQPA